MLLDSRENQVTIYLKYNYLELKNCMITVKKVPTACHIPELRSWIYMFSSIRYWLINETSGCRMWLTGDNVAILKCGLLFRNYNEMGEMVKVYPRTSETKDVDRCYTM